LREFFAIFHKVDEAKIKIASNSFWTFFFSKIMAQNCEAIKGEQVRQINLKLFGYFDAVYVSTFVGGIKKKRSPTFPFKTQIQGQSVFDQNCFQIFLVKLTRKVWGQFFDRKLSFSEFVFQMAKWDCGRIFFFNSINKSGDIKSIEVTQNF
jgi:hypothetical protein